MSKRFLFALLLILAAAIGVATQSPNPTQIDFMRMGGWSPGPPPGCTDGDFYFNGPGKQFTPCGTTTFLGNTSLSNPLTAPNPWFLNVDLHFKGLNPWIDVVNYGARAVNPNTPPAAVGLTASCNSGQPTVTISSASTFQNGDGVVLYGCGATQSMTTPGAPTVTPSVPSSASGVGNLGFTVAGPAGATTYNYQIIARDKNGGMTASSTVGTSATGAASLGTQSVSITSLSRGIIPAGQVAGSVTVVTSSAHGLSVGALVHIAGTSNEADFGGWFNVATVPDNTHFTFINGITTVETATGGTVTWWNCNHLSWTAVTGAWEYYIYGRTGGSLTLLGVSKPTGFQGIAGYADTTWDDYGSPMMDGVALPAYVPNTPPVSATSDHLVTTIASGAGTTSLTLSVNAGTTVASATIRYDAAPNIAAAAAAASGFSNPPPLYFPVSTTGGSYVINSFLDLTSRTISVMQVGSLYLNDTIAVGANAKWYGDRIPPAAGSLSFGFQGNPSVTVATANPGMYVSVSSGIVLRGLTFLANNNAAQMLVVDGGNPVTLGDLSFFSGAGNGDYMSIGLNFRSAGPGANSFQINLDRLLFLAGSQSSATVTPMMICSGCGATTIKNVSLSGRSMFFAASLSGGQPVNLENGYIQGGVQPFLLASNLGLPGGSFVLKQVALDTMANALFAFGSFNTGGNFNSTGPFLTLQLTGAPSSGVGAITGGPLTSIVSDGIASGQNTNLAAVGGGSGGQIFVSSNAIGVGMRPGIQVGGTAGIGLAFPRPAAPTVVLGAGGSCVANCVAAGTYFYFISANDFNGGYSLQSPASAAVTTDGTKTITVSWTPLNGQVTTNPARSTIVANGLMIFQPGGGVVGTSYVDSSLNSYGVSIPLYTTGFQEAISQQGFAGHQVVLVDPVSQFTISTKPTTLTATRNITQPDQSGIEVLGPASPTTNNVPKWSASGLLANGFPVQGTDANLLSSGTVTGTGTTLCTDANGGATTSACITSVAVQSQVTATLGSDNTLTASTATTIITQAVTMPSSGCPCRAFLSYGAYHTTPASATSTNFWVDDNNGTDGSGHVFATTQTATGISPVVNGGNSGSAFTTSTYANNATVTFVLRAISNQGITVKSATTNTFSGQQPTWLQIVIQTSN